MDSSQKPPRGGRELKSNVWVVYLDASLRAEVLANRGRNETVGGACSSLIREGLRARKPGREVPLGQ